MRCAQNDVWIVPEPPTQLCVQLGAHFGIDTFDVNCELWNVWSDVSVIVYCVCDDDNFTVIFGSQT